MPFCAVYTRKFRVWITGQARRVTNPIHHEMRRRAAVEPVIGHVKAEHRMVRKYLKGRDRANAVLSAGGYNFSLLLRWLATLLRVLIQVLATAAPEPKSPKNAALAYFTDDSIRSRFSGEAFTKHRCGGQ